MLSELGSSALDLTEHAFIYLQSIALVPTEQCSGGYGAVLLLVISNEFQVSSFIFLVSSFKFT